jgi:hypothetical protein
MMAFSIVGLLFGALLGIYFRVLVLAPATLMAIVAATSAGITGGESARGLAVSVVAVSALLQAGYVGGCILRAIVSVLSAKNQSSRASEVSKPALNTGGSFR